MAMFVALCLCVWSVGAINVLTQHYDIQRTGANQQETILKPSNVQVSTFGLLWKTKINAPVCGQVLVVENVNINGSGTSYETLYAWTSTNSASGSVSSAYAVDAKTGTIFWTWPLNTSAEFTTDTGVIDEAAGIWYFVTRDHVLPANRTGYAYAHWLHALDLQTGKDKAGSPLLITGAVKSTAANPASTACYNSATGLVDFTYCNSNVRAGLLLVKGIIYIGFAYNTDQQPYHGWILAYSYSGGFKQNAIWCATPASNEGGIWQAGKGLASDGNYVYFTTGNGNYNTSVNEYGMSIVKLDLTTLEVVDYFTPHDWQSQSRGDLDLGNCGPLLLKSPDGTTWSNRIFAGATKYGRSFIVDSTNMGKYNANNDSCLQSFTTGDTDEVGANPVMWSDGQYTQIYQFEPRQQLQQFKFNGSEIINTATWNQVQPVFNGSPYSGGYGGLSTSGSGTTNGILWMTGSTGQIWAFNASDILQKPLWTNADNSSRDGMPNSGHFQFPVVANGRLFACTGGGDIYAYGLL